MTREQAIRILDPETTIEALAEIETYNGCFGPTAKVQACNEACEVAVAAMRELEALESHSNSLASHSEALATGKLESSLKALESNEPLTLEELRQMDGEPVWVEFLNKKVVWRADAWFILTEVRTSEAYLVGSASVYKSFLFYGKEWLAYRRKPEEVGT